MKACSTYSRKGTVHEWRSGATAVWPDMMVSACGMARERKVHLDELIDDLPRCKFCFPKTAEKS